MDLQSLSGFRRGVDWFLGNFNVFFKILELFGFTVSGHEHCQRTSEKCFAWQGRGEMTKKFYCLLLMKNNIIPHYFNQYIIK